MPLLGKVRYGVLRTVYMMVYSVTVPCSLPALEKRSPHGDRLHVGGCGTMRGRAKAQVSSVEVVTCTGTMEWSS